MNAVAEVRHQIFGTQGEPDDARDPLQRLINTLESGRVTRYHAAPTVAPQTNGLHQWGVLMIVFYLTDGDVSKALLTECVAHDSGEYFGGDVPFTAKRDNAELKSLHDLIEDTARSCDLLLASQDLLPQDAALLKTADTLEGLIWCYKTEFRGPVFDRWVMSFRVAARKFQPHLTHEQFQRAVALWHAYTGQLL